MPLQIRPENPDDVDAIRRVNEHAFGRPDEARIVEALRDADALTESLVAVDDGEIVGHIAFSPVEAGVADAIGLAPVAVLPSQQRRGVGARLVRVGLERSRQAGHAVVFVLGDPGYYTRFGFERASVHGFRWEHDAPDEAFMLNELRPGSVAGRAGVVRYHAAFVPR